MNSAKHITVIATSAIPDRPGYRRDLLSCLSYPAGFSVRFHYRRRWIEDSLLQLPNKDTIDQEALLVFCDLPSIAAAGAQNPTTAEADYQFIPLRYVRLQGIDPGEESSHHNDDMIVSVRFMLGDYVHLADSWDDAGYAFDIFQNFIRRKYNANTAIPHSFPRKQGGEQSKFMFQLPISVPGISLEQMLRPGGITEEQRWSRLCAILSTTQALHDCIFFRVVGMYEFDTSRKEEHRTYVNVQDVEGAKSFVFHTEKTYRLGLQFYVDPRLLSQPDWPTVNIPSLLLHKSPMLTQSSGTISDVSVILWCDHIKQDRIIPLIIENPEDDQARIARTDFMILIKSASKTRLIIVLGMLGFGTFLSGISPELLRFLELTQEWLVLISGGLQVIGSVLVVIGAYIAFRATPYT